MDHSDSPLNGAERREWMKVGEWGNGIIINHFYGSFPHSLSTSKKIMNYHHRNKMIPYFHAKLCLLYQIMRNSFGFRTHNNNLSVQK